MTANKPQDQSKQQFSQAAPPPISFRQKWAESWLRRLRTLPEPAYRQAVARLQRGDTARAVAVWLVTLANRGGMQSVTSVWTAEKYLQVLRERVREAMKKLPLPVVDHKKIGKLMAEERKRIDNVIAISGGPLNRETPPDADKPPAEIVQSIPPPKRRRRTKVEQLVADNAEAWRMLSWVNYALDSIHEGLELCAYWEDKFTMPLEQSNRLLRTMAMIIDRGLRAEAAAAKASGTAWENFDAIKH